MDQPTEMVTLDILIKTILEAEISMKKKLKDSEEGVEFYMTNKNDILEKIYDLKNSLQESQGKTMRIHLNEI